MEQAADGSSVQTATFSTPDIDYEITIQQDKDENGKKKKKTVVVKKMDVNYTTYYIAKTPFIIND